MSQNITFYQEKAQKIWAMTPKPEFESFDAITERLTATQRRIAASIPGATPKTIHAELNKDNFNEVLKFCTFGLAHLADLAEKRLQAALERPRLSHDRLYQQSFVEAGYHLGALAVVAFTAFDDSQPETWVVEGFLGDAIEPEVRTLRMDYPTVFGIDVADQTNLNQLIDSWYPPAQS